MGRARAGPPGADGPRGAALIACRRYVVEAENFESIHNHSAYALIEHDKRKARWADADLLAYAIDGLRNARSARPDLFIGKTDFTGKQHCAEPRHFHHFLADNAFQQRFTRAGIVRMFPQPTRFEQ